MASRYTVENLRKTVANIEVPESTPVGTDADIKVEQLLARSRQKSMERQTRCCRVDANACPRQERAHGDYSGKHSERRAGGRTVGDEWVPLERHPTRSDKMMYSRNI